MSPSTAGSGRDGFGSGRGIRATSVIGPTAAGTAMRAIWRPLTGTIEACWNAILADPIAALPHHPMVLHRGGWPDGA